MSIFGLLSLLTFLMVMGGLVALYYSENLDLGLANAVFMVLRLLVCSQVLMAIFEFPCFIADVVVFISMGKPDLAKIIFSVFGLVVFFVVIIILPKINWRKHVTPTLGKMIFLGLLFLSIFSYNELLAGAYSFDSIEEFNQTREMYEDYDNHFWPTKYIKYNTPLRDQECIALCPFDVTMTNGTEVEMYKGETFIVTNEDGTQEIFFYPFTWKLYEEGEVLSFDAPVASPSDVPPSSSDLPAETPAQ